MVRIERHPASWPWFIEWPNDDPVEGLADHYRDAVGAVRRQLEAGRP
jgi:hypothetical protein